jgi:hypothetical protein
MNFVREGYRREFTINRFTILQALDRLTFCRGW